MLLLTLPLLALATPQHEQCDRLCIDKYDFKINEKFRIYFPWNQVEHANSNFSVSVFAGDLAYDQKSDPCDSTNSLYTMKVHPSKFDERLAYVDYWVDKDLFDARYYLQLRMDRTCMLGPRAAGNEFTSFSISPAQQIRSAGDGGSDGAPQIPNGENPAGTNPTGNTSNSSSGLSVAAIVSLSAAGMVIAAFMGVMYVRYKNSVIGSDSNRVIMVVNERKMEVGPKELESNEEAASRISKAYRDALANPRWSMSIDSTHEKINFD